MFASVPRFFIDPFQILSNSAIRLVLKLHHLDTDWLIEKCHNLNCANQILDDEISSQSNNKYGAV